jgi:Putative zinc-finger
MRTLSCASTRRRLQAFHDRELPVSDQIAVGAHLERCGECANQYAELRFVRAALRATAPGRTTLSALSREEAAGFNAAIVNRLKAEYDQSFFVRVREMFADMHLVYAALGAAAATAVCVMVMLGMMRFATKERPDSLAAIVNLLAAPGSNANPVDVDARMQMPRALDAAISADSNADEDAVFALAAVVTREGRIGNLEMLRANGARSGARGAEQTRVVENLMDAISRARFEPAQKAGLPVAVNMVWLVAHTTVRGNKHHALQPAAPAVKKPAASIYAPSADLATA